MFPGSSGFSAVMKVEFQIFFILQFLRILYRRKLSAKTWSSCERRLWRAYLCRTLSSTNIIWGWNCGYVFSQKRKGKDKTSSRQELRTGKPSCFYALWPIFSFDCSDLYSESIKSKVFAFGVKYERIFACWRKSSAVRERLKTVSVILSRIRLLKIYPPPPSFLADKCNKILQNHQTVRNPSRFTLGYKHPFRRDADMHVFTYTWPTNSFDYPWNRVAL